MPRAHLQHQDRHHWHGRQLLLVELQREEGDSPAERLLAGLPILQERAAEHHPAVARRLLTCRFTGACSIQTCITGLEQCPGFYETPDQMAQACQMDMSCNEIWEKVGLHWIHHIDNQAHAKLPWCHVLLYFVRPAIRLCECFCPATHAPVLMVKDAQRSARS